MSQDGGESFKHVLDFFVPIPCELKDEKASLLAVCGASPTMKSLPLSKLFLHLVAETWSILSLFSLCPQFSDLLWDRGIPQAQIQVEIQHLSACPAEGLVCGSQSYVIPFALEITIIL